MNFYTNNLEKNQYLLATCFSILLIENCDLACIQAANQNSIRGNLWNCELAHTSYCNK